MINRVGKIRVTSKIVERGVEVPSVFEKIKFTPLHIELLEVYQNYVFTGISPVFDELYEGELIPTYVVTIYTESQTVVKCEVSRIL